MIRWQIEIIDNEGKSVFIGIEGVDETKAKECVQELAEKGVWYPEDNKKTFLPPHRIHLAYISKAK